MFEEEVRKALFMLVDSTEANLSELDRGNISLEEYNQNDLSNRDRALAAILEAHNKGQRELLERVHCCDNEPVSGEPINVCNDDHLRAIAQLTPPKGDE